MVKFLIISDMSKRNLYFDISSNLASSKIENELIVLNIDSGKYLQIKGSGVFIWELLEEGKKSEKDILETLIDVFDDDEVVLKNDLNIFLKDATEKGLLNEVIKNR